MKTYYIIYFAGMIVALLLYVLNLRISIKTGLKEIPSLVSVLGTKEQQKKAIINSILTYPLAYLPSWLSAIVHIVMLVDHGIWRYRQRNRKKSEQ